SHRGVGGVELTVHEELHDLPRQLVDPVLVALTLTQYHQQDTGPGRERHRWMAEAIGDHVPGHRVDPDDGSDVLVRDPERAVAERHVLRARPRVVLLDHLPTLVDLIDDALPIVGCPSEAAAGGNM